MSLTYHRSDSVLMKTQFLLSGYSWSSEGRNMVKNIQMLNKHTGEERTCVLRRRYPTVPTSQGDLQTLAASGQILAITPDPWFFNKCPTMVPLFMLCQRHGCPCLFNFLVY